MVVAGVAGDGVQDDDADAGKGKHRVAQDGQGGVALIGTPVILRQQADQDAQDGRQPNQAFHSYGSLKLREGGLPDIQQDDIEYRHGDGRDLQPDAELLFDPVAAASHGPDDPGHQMEGVTAAEGQGQDAIQDKKAAALSHREKEDACGEIKDQVGGIEHRLHPIGHFGLIGFMIHDESFLSF